MDNTVLVSASIFTNSSNKVTHFDVTSGFLQYSFRFHDHVVLAQWQFRIHYNSKNLFSFWYHMIASFFIIVHSRCESLFFLFPIRWEYKMHTTYSTATSSWKWKKCFSISLGSGRCNLQAFSWGWKTTGILWCKCWCLPLILSWKALQVPFLCAFHSTPAFDSCSIYTDLNSSFFISHDFCSE